MEKSFKLFLDTYMDAWNTSSITKLSELISKDYKGREIANGEVIDFGFDESIQGWEQGFNFVKENVALWDLKVIFTQPLRDDEILVLISASMIVENKSLKTANLFFQTFKKIDNNWKLARSYIEAGIPQEKLSEKQFS